MKPFEFVYPQSFPEAARMLRERGEQAQVLAGGTDLMVHMKRGLCSPRYLVSLRKIERTHGRAGSGGGNSLKIGSLSCLAELERPGGPVEERAALFFEAARSIGSPQIRSRATVGGNLCQELRCIYYDHPPFWQDSLKPCWRRGGFQCYIQPGSRECVAGYYSDLAVALMALDAQIDLVGIQSLEERTVDLEDFLRERSRGGTRDVVRSLQVPVPAQETAGVYLKYARRKGVGFAVLNAAILLQWEEDRRRVREGRIVVGGLSRFPRHAAQAENRLRGAALEDHLISDLARCAADEVPIFGDPFFSVENKKSILAALIERGMQRLKS